MSKEDRLSSANCLLQHDIWRNFEAFHLDSPLDFVYASALPKFPAVENLGLQGKNHNIT
jgi:hypothetical protein